MGDEIIIVHIFTRNSSAHESDIAFINDEDKSDDRFDTTLQYHKICPLSETTLDTCQSFHKFLHLSFLLGGHDRSII